ETAVGFGVPTIALHRLQQQMLRPGGIALRLQGAVDDGGEVAARRSLIGMRGHQFFENRTRLRKTLKFIEIARDGEVRVGTVRRVRQSSLRFCQRARKIAMLVELHGKAEMPLHVVGGYSVGGAFENFQRLVVIPQKTIGAAEAQMQRRFLWRSGEKSLII